MNISLQAASHRAPFEGKAVTKRPLFAGRRSRQGLSRTAIQAMLLFGVAAVELLISTHLSNRMSDVLGYATRGIVLLTGGVAAITRGRLAEERMKLRWMLLGLSLCGGALAYFIASANNFSPVFHVLDPLMHGAGAAGSAAVMLSITVSFSGTPLGIRLLDLAQTALYIALSYLINAGSNPWARDVQSHVIISLLLALMLFVTASVAPLSASSEEERRFFKIVAVYLGASWVGRFISSQVGYLWMNARGNRYDLLSIGVCVIMSLYLTEIAWQASQKPRPDRELIKRRLMLRNLMPSLLAFTSFSMALYVFLHAHLAGLLAVLCAVTLYLSRTLLLQTHMARETTDLRHRNEQLQEISHRDTLTRAGNRRSLALHYDQCLDDRQAALAMLLVDLDFFKQANDLLGHLHGDHILQQVANVLHAACRPVEGSHVARFGGDEFALLLPHINPLDAAELAETIRVGVEVLALEAGDHTISVSIGGVSAKGIEPLEELIRRADIALYRAKYRGRNRAEFDSTDTAAPEDSPSLTLVSVS